TAPGLLEGDAHHPNFRAMLKLIK
ncbi:MAG: hypothetical protein QOF17_1370, partial [Solirubrobacteraceae bacterium]|nr:hypothetical protein [Solirubrobacteraceae bacterium]